MKSIKQVMRLILLFFISIGVITSCSDPEAKVVFKFTETPGDKEITTNVTNAEGTSVLRYTTKTTFTSTYEYNKYNTSQVEGIISEKYIPIETGEKVLIDTYMDLDVYERPTFQKLTSKDGKVLGYHGAIEYNGAFYPTEKFVTILPVKIYSYDGEEIKLEERTKTDDFSKKDQTTSFPHSTRFNMIFTKELDGLIALPRKTFKDSLSSRIVGFTSINLDGVDDIFPYIYNIDTKEQIIYDRIPSSNKKDFQQLAIGEVKLK